MRESSGHDPPPYLQRTRLRLAWRMMKTSAHPLEAASRLRARWRAGESTYGGWLYLRDSLSAELVARAGFDWVCIDAQHGTARAGDIVPLLQAIAGAGGTAVVRVPWNEPGVIMNALDAGASGVIVPMVNTAAEAEQAVASCRYPPQGNRSWGPTRAALGASNYSAVWANERVLCIVMVETPAGVDNVDEILEVPGVDAVFVGPTDLALSFGVERDEQTNIDRIAAIKRACDARTVPAGIAAIDVEEAKRSAGQGFAMVALPSDAVLLAQSCATLLASVRADI